VAAAAGLAPEAAFDREWALALVERALALLENESDDRAHFAALKRILDREAPDYAR